MRLRYLHLQNYPPISNIKVCFASSSPLTRDCAIRFVVGINGSGKSNLLRAVAEVFLALADLRVPAFPVSLVYELGARGSPNHRTLLLHCSGNRQQASLWLHERFAFDDQNGKEIFEGCIEHLALKGLPSVPGFTALIEPGNWPLRDSTPPQIALPSAVLVYTTGDLRPWRSVWSRNQNAEGLQPSGENAEIEERPAGWTAAQEGALLAVRPHFNVTQDVDMGVSPAASETFRRPVLLDATLLKCALLAVTLPQAFIETTDYSGRDEVDAAMATLLRRDNNKNPLQELLERGGWHHLASVTFRSRLQSTHWDEKLCATAHDWWLCASEVIAEPHPMEARRMLWFDLKGPFDAQAPSFASAARDELQTCKTHGEALWALLGGAKDASAFDLFTRLLELKQAGLFDDVLLRLRRHPTPNASTDAAKRDIGVLRYEELSDGEQMFMGRMALFHLMSGRQDSLLLLDEPETHFNDLWKRDVVSVVDDALAHTSADVLIATHAALMLTDALKDELIVLERTSPDDDAGPGESSVRTLDAQTHTFGATGDHPLRDVFGASDTVGRRASRLLEVLIATAQFGAEVERYWREMVPWSDDLIQRILQVAKLTESGLTHSHVAEYLDSFTRFAVYFGVQQPLTMRTLLEAFIRQTGPGYFQVELKRAWRRTMEGAVHAP
jgi:ABC-type transport system involved in cytochrome c biogenesis ATPase subunit